MKTFICKKCNKEILCVQIINGKKYNIHTRKYCFDCNPILEKRSCFDENGNRFCIAGCNNFFPNNDEFFKIDNRGNLTSDCIKCFNKNHAKIKRNQKLLDVKKIGYDSCKICGYNKSVSALTFHHLNPSEKEDKIMNLFSTKRELELKKCILVCENCHSEIHAGLHPNILKVEFSENKKTIYISKQRLKNKQDHVNYLGGSCMKCGYNKCLRSLDFHHKNPEDKLFQISSKRYSSLEEIKSEIEKCILLCNNCHREIHTSNL